MLLRFCGYIDSIATILGFNRGAGPRLEFSLPGYETSIPARCTRIFRDSRPCLIQISGDLLGLPESLDTYQETLNTYQENGTRIIGILSHACLMAVTIGTVAA